MIFFHYLLTNENIMSASSKIEWTQGSWNPITGCTKLSPGCAHCYAHKMALRQQGMGRPKYRNGFAVTCHPEELQVPLTWNKSKMIFTCSMSDLFHKDVPFEFISSIFEVMGQASWHTFQVLTKRAERLAELGPLLPWTPNIWAGVTIESDAYAARAEALKSTPAAVKFVSLEPLLGPLPSLEMAGLHWVIVGGESGPGARPMEASWVTELRDKATAEGVPFFFKQWGGRSKKLAGRLLEGRTWDEFPA